MAGHNKWSKIKHRKAVVDKRRGKVWTKCAKAIMVAAKHGGGDPDSNLSLRYAIDEARYANMPRDTIERAVKKGAGELGGEDWETLRYEGYGPRGVAVVVEALTNNRTRTATDVRNAFTKYGGNLGLAGCVGFLFESKGVIEVDASGKSEDEMVELAINAGASDATKSDDDDDGAGSGGGANRWTVSTAPLDFHAVKTAIERAGLIISDARIDMIPSTAVTITGDDARTAMKLIDTLEDNDDVQKVYCNMDIPEGDLAGLED
ncbi:MAG: YebC/PmpR family DNA-binding transcriptional regulator [Phycisphaerales bacterium]|nr:YebC/PmpR family DNA-binding transcriptional regulator [Phycisphaerales bacterium]